MKQQLITICTVNYNSSEFISMMLYSFRNLSVYPYKVIIRDNNSKKTDYEKLKNFITNEKYNNVELYRVETTLIGSEAHGTALNDLVGKINTPYFCILDADAIFLKKDWDKILISYLDDKVKLIGTQASNPNALDFVSTFAVLGETESFKKLNIDFRPKDLLKFQDTEWDLREKYLNAKLSSRLLYDFNTRIYKKGPFSKVVCSEFYLSNNGDGSIFASHFGRGSSPKTKNLFKINAGSNILLRIINRGLIFINVIKWKKDKKNWLNICKKIIDNQI